MRCYAELFLKQDSTVELIYFDYFAGKDTFYIYPYFSHRILSIAVIVMVIALVQGQATTLFLQHHLKRFMKSLYKDKIKVFCGLEFDMYSEIDLAGYDYLIGAVHYLKCENELIGLDRSQNVVKMVIDKYFGGDGMKYAKEYYKTLAKLPEYGKFDIIGHFDLITKHSDNVIFFDENSKEWMLRISIIVHGRVCTQVVLQVRGTACSVV